jgi:hypothetical protein
MRMEGCCLGRGVNLKAKKFKKRRIRLKLKLEI